MKRRVLLLACFLLAGGCAGDLPGSVESLLPPTPGPGTSAWRDHDISCKSQRDCQPGEACVDNICQVQRCAEETYSSTAPLGKTTYFQVDKEIVVTRADDLSPRIETYEPLGYTFYSPDSSSIWADGAVPTDLVGGNFLGTAPEVVALVQEADDYVRFVGDGIDQKMALTFRPNAIAGGDIDFDGVDEFGVTSHGGDFAICSAVTGTCSHSGNVATLVGDDVVVRDAAMADVDGDGQAELLFVGDSSSEFASCVLGVYNADHEQTGQPELIHHKCGMRADRISAADLDGDRIAEIFVLDNLFGGEVRQIKVDDDSIKTVGVVRALGTGRDILAADIDSDGRTEVMVLMEYDQVDVFTGSGAPGLHRMFTTGLSMTKNATRLAAIDRDADSPRGVLMDGPNLVPGNMVPIMVALYPPYSHEFSDGSPRVTVGRKEGANETKSHAVWLNAGLTVGVDGEIPGIMKFFLGARIQETIEWNEAVTTSFMMWESFNMHATPEVQGLYNGGVMVGCGCFHQYKYRVEDPAGLMAGVGKTMDMYVPIGGQTHIMSIRRYNAMAEAIGNMPIINVPYRVGDATSYPVSPETLDGAALSQEDLVFTPSNYRVSDTAETSWLLAFGEQQSNSVSNRVYAAALADVRVGFGVGLNIRAEVGAGVGQGYEISVSEMTVFSGSVPPIRDDPDTPEDEYALHGYSFSPIVYRHRYTDRFGNESGYFVHTYAVSP